MNGRTDHMANNGSELHEITSIGRPIDPSHPTNRAMLLLLPVAATVAGILAASQDAGVREVLLRAGGGALAAFGAWAVAREIVPDDEIAGAFLAMTLGYGAYLGLDAALAPLFAGLFYARVVSRSTGRAATGLDSLAVTGFALFTAWRTGTPWPAVVGAVAFGLDAVLTPGLARQWLFAGLCGAGAIALTTAGLTPDVTPLQPDLVPRTIATIVVVGAIALIATTRSVAARGDLTGAPLSVGRVRGAQAVVLLTALATAASGSAGIEAGSPIWGCLAGVTLPAAWRGLRRGD